MRQPPERCPSPRPYLQGNDVSFPEVDIDGVQGRWQRHPLALAEDSGHEGCWGLRREAANGVQRHLDRHSRRWGHVKSCTHPVPQLSCPVLRARLGRLGGYQGTHRVQLIPLASWKVPGHFRPPGLQHGGDEQSLPPQELAVHGPGAWVLGEPARKPDPHVGKEQVRPGWLLVVGVGAALRLLQELPQGLGSAVTVLQELLGFPPPNTGACRGLYRAP